MHIFIDLAIILVVFLISFHHYRMGLVCSVLNFGKFIFAVITSTIFKAPIAMWVQRIFESNGFTAYLSGKLSGIIAFSSIFIITIAVSNAVIFCISKIKIPIITRFDKYLGLVLGICIGVLAVSLISTVVFSIIEFYSSVNSDSKIMNAFDDSAIFKFVYNLKIFEYIRNLNFLN